MSVITAALSGTGCDTTGESVKMLGPDNHDRQFRGPKMASEMTLTSVVVGQKTKVARL
jgi:hypothetical protein